MPAVAPHAQEQLEFEDIGKIRENLVLQALSNPSWDFRTVAGIAKEAGLSERDVEKVLGENPRLFRRSAVPDPLGRPIYTLQAKPVGSRERIAILRMFLTKSIP